MPEAAVHEINMSDVVKANAVLDAKGARSDAVVLTGENFEKFVDKALAKPGAEPEPAAAETPEAKAAEELKKVEAEKAARKAKDAAETEEIDHPDKTAKGKLNERFSDLTAKRKAAEAKAETEAKAAREARDRADTLQQERDALRAKYEPPKPDDLGPEPLPAQFTDVVEYGKALKDWTAESVRREDAKKQSEARANQERAEQVKAWDEREAEVIKEVPDYAEKKAKSEIKVSDELHQALLESDQGPRIANYLMDHPEEAARIGKMTVYAMQRRVGQLEATVGKSPSAAAPQKEPSRAQISGAPPPISPLGTGGAPVVRLTGAQDVPKNWTYEDYKKARQAGQIK